MSGGNGGALYVTGGNENEHLVVSNSVFTNNTAQNYGGAIFLAEKSYLELVDTNITGNTSNGQFGGGIHVSAGSTLDVIAKSQDVMIYGNYSSGSSNDISMEENSTVNLISYDGHNFIIGTIYKVMNTKHSTIYAINKDTNKPANFYFKSNPGNIDTTRKDSVGTVNICVYGKNADANDIFDNIKLNLSQNTSLSISDGKINDISLESLNVTNGGSARIAIDVSLKSRQADKITAGSASGSFKVGTVNIISNSKTPVDVPITDKDSVIGSVTTDKAESAEATYKLKTYYDENGLLRARITGQRAKSSAVAAPVAAQIGGYLAQINSYDQAFANLDMDMLKTREERKAEEMMNKYAAASTNVGPTYSEKDGMNYNSKGLWNRAFATFENVPLNNGPKVNNVGYGNYFGGDMGKKELSNGWSRQFSAYIGYNGSTQDYTKQSIDQNGGTLGIMETWYKGNFFTALTANVGGNNAEANTDLGKERMAMLMAGVASKTGYNFEFKQGKFIIQPSILISYSFINTFDHNNGLGHNVSSSPIHAIQVAPGIKFIANLKNGWQPYFGINMRWNIMDKASFSIPDVTIPTMSVDPYVEYGVGIQKRWGDRFTGYGQAMIRNGGRNGVMLNIGFRWAIGK